MDERMRLLLAPYGNDEHQNSFNTFPGIETRRDAIRFQSAGLRLSVFTLADQAYGILKTGVWEGSFPYSPRTKNSYPDAIAKRGPLTSRLTTAANSNGRRGICECSESRTRSPHGAAIRPHVADEYDRYLGFPKTFDE